MPNKFDSGTAIIPVAHPNGELHDIEFPTDLPVSQLHDALSDSGYLHEPTQPSADNALENDPAFKKAASEAYSRSLANNNPNTRIAKEWGFSVGAHGEIGPMVAMDDDATHGQLKINVRDDDIGAVHTHDFRHEATPSPRDIQSSREFKKTIYVASRAGLTAIAPDGTTTKVYDYPEDIGNKKKKAK
jgi:hypothetical protein